MKIAALVPMRHHSQRVPGKNYRQLAGEPLFHYILDSLSECPLITDILVDTDSTVILDDIEKNFPAIIKVNRPEALRGDEVPMNQILIYDTQHIPADLYLQTHSTNPFLKPKTITRAIETFLENTPRYDSLFSVTRIQTRLWDSYAKAINHDPNVLLQTQDLPPIYEENSCIYIFTSKKLLEKKNRIGEKPFLFEISTEEALDIDDESDFLIADLLMHHFKGSPLV